MFATSLDAPISMLLLEVPIAPEPDVRVTVPPVSVPVPLSVIVPVPLAVRVTVPVPEEEPVVTLALITTPALVPACSSMAPVLPTVMELLTVMFPADAAVSINENVELAPLAVDTPEIVTALLSVT